MQDRTPPADDSHGVARLKALLFERENERIAELAARLDTVAADLSDLDRQARDGRNQVESVHQRVGTDEALRKSVSGIIDGAIRDAEVARHDQLARAVAPVVVKTIRTELRNSQDDMVQLLYPLTGRMVQAYVKTAIKDLTADINRRLGRNPVMLRLRSLSTGRSMAELAIVDSQRLEVEEIFLIRRGSGERIASWPARAGASNVDVHLSGVLAAINEYALTALGEKSGGIRSFEVDEYRVFLRASPVYLLAARCRGIEPPGVDGLFDEAFLEVLEEYPGERLAEAGALEPLAARLNERLRRRYEDLADESAGTAPLRVIGYTLGALVLAWLGWSLYTMVTTESVRARALAEIAAVRELKGYPLTLEVAPRGAALTLSGLVPSAAVRTDLLSRLRTAIPATEVVDGLAVIPVQTAADPGPELVRLRRELAALESGLLRAGIARNLERAVQRLAEATGDLERLSSAWREPRQVEVVAQAQRAARSAASAIAGVSATLERPSLDVAGLQALREPLGRLDRELGEAAGGLAALIRSGNPPARASDEPRVAVDATRAAEGVASAADRLASLALAAVQLASLKPVEVRMPREPTPLEQLDAWVRRNAVFFANGTDLRSPDAARRTLGELAVLMRASDAVVRVVGYTDEIGAPARNNPLAINRAEAVVAMLTALGIDRSRLVVVGRANGPDLSSGSGPGSPNRRVQFELALVGESGGAPATTP